MRKLLSVWLSAAMLWFFCEPAEVEEHCGTKIISYEYNELIKLVQ